MTEAIGSQLSAETEAGVRIGFGLSLTAARHGKEPSADWVGAPRSNVPTSSTSESPTFRASWQSVVNAWRGVSQGSNGVESEEAEESGTSGAASTEEKGLAAKNGQNPLSTSPANSSVASNLAATSHSVFVSAQASQEVAVTQTSRSAWRAAQDVNTQASSPIANTDAIETARSRATSPNHLEIAAGRENQEIARQAPEFGAQSVALVAAAPILPPTAPASPESSTQAQILRTTSELPATTPLFSSAPETFGLSATQVSEPPAVTGAGARLVHTAPESILRCRTQINSAHQAAPSFEEDSSEPASSRQATSARSTETSAAEVSREPTVNPAAGSAFQSGRAEANSRADNSTYSGFAPGTTDSSTFAAAASSTVQASADAARGGQKPSVERLATRAASRGAAQDNAAPALSFTAQQVSADAASVAQRTPAAAQASVAAVSGHAQISTANSSATSAQNTFSALDGGTSLGAPTWTHAGGQHAEAGFRDPDLGWIGVRADLSASGIHATLVPDSADADQALSGHLAGISTHLVEQHASVASLSMASRGDSGEGSGIGQRMQQSAEGSPQGQASEQSQTTQRTNSLQRSGASVLALSAEGDDLGSIVYAGSLRGTRISVMA